MKRCSFVGGLHRWFLSNGARHGMPALRIQNDAFPATSMDSVLQRVYEHTHGSSPSAFDIYMLSFSFNDVLHYAAGTGVTCVPCNCTLPSYLIITAK